MTGYLSYEKICFIINQNAMNLVFLDVRIFKFVKGPIIYYKYFEFVYIIMANIIQLNYTKLRYI